MSEGTQPSWSAESATDTDRALDETHRWIEACTGEEFASDDFRLAVRDGVLLCKLANVIQEGSVNLKKVQTTQATFVWLENLNYFIEACKKLGLKGGQLFNPSDLIAGGEHGGGDAKAQSGKRTEQERRVRNVAITVFWLGKKANRIKTFEGPKLNLTEFKNIVPESAHAVAEVDPVEVEMEAETGTTPEPTPEPESLEPPPPAVSPGADSISSGDEIIETEVITTVTKEVRRVIKRSPKLKHGSGGDTGDAQLETITQTETIKETVEERPLSVRRLSSATELRKAFMSRSPSSEFSQSSGGRSRTGSRSRSDISTGRPKSGVVEATADDQSLALCLDLSPQELEFGFTLQTDYGQPPSVLSVNSGSAADRVGLLVGDKLFWVNGESVAFVSKSELDTQLEFICAKERVLTLGIRRTAPAQKLDEVEEPQTIKEEATAVMVPQVESGPEDLVAALKEFQEKAEPPQAEDQDRSPEPPDATAGLAPGVAVLKGFSTHNTGSAPPAMARAATGEAEKVDESCAMQKLSAEQSKFSPHGAVATVYVAQPKKAKGSTDDTTKLGLAAAASAVVVESELPKSDVRRHRWNSTTSPPASGLPQTRADDDKSYAALLRRLQGKYGEEEDKEKFRALIELVRRPEFESVVVAVREVNKSNSSKENRDPAKDSACPVCRKTQHTLNKKEEGDMEAAALAEIMAAPHFRGLCYAHDQLLLKKKQETSSATASLVAATKRVPEPSLLSPGANAIAAVAVANKVQETVVQKQEPREHGEPDGALATSVSTPAPAAAPAPAATAATTAAPAPAAAAAAAIATAATVAAASGEVKNLANGVVKHPEILMVEKQANKPLGATVRTEHGKVYVARMLAGSTLSQSGKLHVDDEILEINGERVTSDTIIDVLGRIPNGELSMKIMPAEIEGAEAMNTEMNVRALFSYNPAEDELLPCKEVGLPFKKGDILHIVNRSDADWWQAVKDGEGEDGMAGLIPSKFLQERRDSYQQIVKDDEKRANEKKRKHSKLHIPKRKKKKSSLYEAKQNAYNFDEVLTYEEVFLVKPDVTKKRPIVIVGPIEGGREALKVSIIDNNPERFATAIPHTTRPIREDEVPGDVYNFITKQQFQEKLKQTDFFEHGEHKDNFYGTSIEAVREVLLSGRVCIITAHPESLRLLRASNMQPFVVFLRPAPATRTPGIDSESDEMQARGHEVAIRMEELYGHMFERTIVNHDVNISLQEILEVAHFLETKSQWVHLARK